eukprot:Unigene8975_Nuclearia_a/m.27468 Unigene8975_Nuclearia_a/g.27468  ORF Unigene8975_Nuclearia_a/g.27468 Unigene8975_Nuclearia_a/m.27468 type:complete len:316 (-) Unigene8975_Nuclearia_a:78-1025(-)
MANRVKGLDELEFEQMRGGERLSVVLGVSGWLKKDKDVVRPWTCLINIGDQYAVRWDTQQLLALNQAFTKFITDEAVGMVVSTVLRQTLLAGLLMAIAWPATLLKAARVIDNPWSVCMERARHLGEVLADILAARKQGMRPVTLVGYSLGARAIFVCLQELAKRGLRGIVEDAFLIGTPAPNDVAAWQAASSVIAGRLVNAHAPNDWFLAFVYRATSVQLGIAGIHPVPVEHVENIDISAIVPSHFKLRARMPLILERLGADVDPSIVAAKKSRMAAKAAAAAAVGEGPSASESSPLLVSPPSPRSPATSSSAPL